MPRLSPEFIVRNPISSVRGTIYEAFRATADRYPAHDFLCITAQTAARYAMAPRSFSYSEAAAEVARLRQHYQAARLGLGHRVGLMLENRPDFFFHWLALNALGVSIVPINPDWRSAELEYLVSHSEISCAVVPPERVGGLQAAATEAGKALVVTASDLLSLHEVLPVASAERGPDTNTECALLYTSGTSGRPKGCVLPNEYFLWAGQWYASIGGLCGIRPGEERLITPLPMSHMNAMAYSTMVMLLTGGCIVPLDRFHPHNWWDSVRQSRATIVHYLGVMPAMLLGSEPEKADRDHCVRFGFGAGVSPRLHALFEDRFGFPLLEAWAMTETGAGAVVIANREPRKVGTACFGKPEARLECRIVDDAECEVGPGQPGELLVRGAAPEPRFGFFREYLKDEEATRDAWNGGYFRTGDIVAMDADGELHFIDRKKNVIRRSGENISAVEVESVLLQHPRIANVGVTAVPDEVRGDEVMACVVTATSLGPHEQLAFAQNVLEFCLQRLAYHKAPGYIAVCDSLPLTPTEKIQRSRLKDLAHGLLVTNACIDLRSLKKRTTP